MAPANLIGEFADVTITEVGSNSLFGALAAPADTPRAKAGRDLQRDMQRA